MAFSRTMPARTRGIAGWSEPESTPSSSAVFLALNGVTETLFLENCNEFSELVRTGDSDFLLLKLIDEQFLVTCRRSDLGDGRRTSWMGRWGDGAGLCSDASGSSTRSASSFSSSSFACRRPHRLQLHAALNVVLRLDGPQPEPDGDVVALLEPRPLPPARSSPDTWAGAGRPLLHLRPAGSCSSSTSPPAAMVKAFDRGTVAFTCWRPSPPSRRVAEVLPACLAGRTGAASS